MAEEPASRHGGAMAPCLRLWEEIADRFGESSHHRGWVNKGKRAYSSLGCRKVALFISSGLSHTETWPGCIDSLTTPTSSLFSASRSVSSLSLAEKLSRVFLASYFLLKKRLSMKDWMRRLKGLNNAAITRVETTIASCGCCSWPVNARNTAWTVATPPK